MKDLSPYSPQRVILLEPKDALSNGRQVAIDGEAPNLRDYWHVVRKHKWKIVGCFVAGHSKTVIAFYITPIDTAGTTLIERKDLRCVISSGAFRVVEARRALL